MENRSLERALDIISKLISGEVISETGANAALYQEYSNNASVYDLVQTMQKKMNLRIYEYHNCLYLTAGDNNTVFGYSNEDLKRELGIRLNKELYLAYFVIYATITEFYSDTANTTYAEFVRVEEVIRDIDKTLAGVIDNRSGIVMDEVEENSFRQIALTWEELPATTALEMNTVRAARNSRTGFVKMVFNFLMRQELLVENQERFYPTNRFRALIENYFDEYRGRFAELLLQAKEANKVEIPQMPQNEAPQAEATQAVMIQEELTEEASQEETTQAETTQAEEE